MSNDEDDIIEIKSTSSKKSLVTKRNKISSPPGGSPQSTNNKKRGDIIEMFTIKSQQKPPHPKPRKHLPKKKLTSSDSQETSELSDDVFINKPQTTPSASSLDKSDNTRSYKDKINERFRTMKEKAGTSSKKAFNIIDTIERRAIDRVRRESDNIDAELATVKAKFNLGTGNSNQLYNFFCSENIQESEAVIEEHGTKSTEHLAKSDEITEFCLPERINYERETSERELLYKPRAIMVDIDDKISDSEPRDLKNEGFYVPKFSNIPREHLLLLEQRLSKDNKSWFTCEGKLNILENPTTKSSFRSEIEPLSTYETTVYLPATTREVECEEVMILSENILELQLHSLKFTHHPLYSLEHMYEQRLENVYQIYEKMNTNNNIKRLNQKLSVMREVKQKLEQSQMDDQRLNNYKTDVRKLQDQLLKECKYFRQTLKLILKTWKCIKRIRQQNQYSNTKIQLIILKDNVDYEQEKLEYDKQFEEFYEEIVSELNEEKRQGDAPFDEEEIRNKLSIKFKESFKPPGEPLLSFVIKYENEITKDVENAKEITRRNVVSSTKLTLRILCNKIEVCKTKPVNLNDNFVCNFDETISIQLVTIPKSITVEIIEQPKALIKRCTGEISIKVPSRTVAKNNKKVSSIDFVKNEIVHYKHEGIGSGIKIKDVLEGEVIVDGNDDEELNTAGLLNYTIAWDKPLQKTDNLIDNECNDMIDKITDKYGKIDLDSLSEWLNRNKPDPQDPKNSILYEFSLDEDLLSDKKNNYFRLSPYLEELVFCDSHILDENLRLQVLQLRDSNEPEFDRMVVPNRIKEIPLSILEPYQKRIQKEKDQDKFDDDDDNYEEDEHEIEHRRCRGLKRLKQVYIKVYQTCKNAQYNLNYEDVVDEKLLLHFEKAIKRMAEAFINWFRWRPKDLPEEEIHKPKTLFPHHQLNVVVKVIVNVLGAVNIPERISANGNNKLTKPYIEIEYNGITARTSASQGPNPTWNEELFLPLESSHVDYLNPNSLNGCITVSIFDEKDEDLKRFGGIKGKNWLGYLEIPLSAVCYSELEGMFKMKMPQLLLGYEREIDKQMKTSKVINVQPNQETYLNLSLRIEPNIPKLTPSIDELHCVEVPYLMDHIIAWNQNFNENFPNRKFPIFVIDPHATTTCIIRYIKPVEPPQINVEGFDVTEEQCVRYVTQIPFTNCNQFYQNVWLPVDQFLHYMSGSVIDHAIALTCYFLALKLEAWLLLGFGIPNGSTAFVLMREYDPNGFSYYIYDVISGEKYYLTDVYCPLQRIYCVINETNIWANIQRGDNINIMRFDFTRRSDWSPLFNSKITAPSNSIHGKVMYLPISDTRELELVLEKKIRKKIGKLRPLDRTIWNHHICNTFKSCLNSFEDSMMYGKNNIETFAKIKNYTSNFIITGYVVNFPFTTVSSIIKRVKSFGVHLQEDPCVEFASAVYVKSYPNQILSVWIFLAALIPK